MATETEFKLSLAPDHVAQLLQSPLLASPPVCQHLRNTYFDTDDLALTQKKVAVRERVIGTETLLTVKTAGHSQNGLSHRQEWEAPTQPGAFDFRALVDDADLANALAILAPKLIPVFTTDFERLSWLIDLGSSRVEIALDRGNIVAQRNGRQASVPICELELELKAGDPEALNTLAYELGQAAALTGTDASKAARGYTLFHSLA